MRGTVEGARREQFPGDEGNGFLPEPAPEGAARRRARSRRFVVVAIETQIAGDEGTAQERLDLEDGSGRC